MPIVQNEKSITVGPLHTKFFSEELGGCFLAGCLENARLSLSRNMRAIICSGLEPPIAYRALDPGMGLSLSAKEISAVMMAIGAGSGASIVTGSGIDTLVGNPAAASSVASPAEWHVIKLSAAAGPWDFTVYAENRDLYFAAGTFVKGTDIEVYLAANNNGDANVAASALTYVAPPGPYGASGSFSVSDACLGKIVFNGVTDAVIVQWTWDASAAPFTINGTYPIVEGDVRHGDTVALIGIAYKWGKVYDAAGVMVPFANRQKVLVARARQQPIGIKAVHFFEADNVRKALIIRIWKAQNLQGFGIGFDSAATRDITLDTNFMGLDDKRNHPESPIGEIEIVDSATDLSIDTLL